MGESKMRLMTIALAGLLTIGLSSCNDFSGEFKTGQKLKIVHTSMFGKKKTKKIPAGSYRATLGFSSSSKVKLSLKRSGQKDIDVKIKLPDNAQFPTYEGDIVIPASQSGQIYDLNGKIATNVTRSGRTDTYESCSYTDYVRRCEKVCRDVTRPNGDVVKRCKKECRRVAVTIRGSRDVTYHMVYTAKKIKLGVFNPGSRDRLGDFQGNFNDSTKVYDYQSSCR
ncbi:MAG: hypothetical protein ACJAT2_001834 [Bacteriovoracaceae bacterium]|jgi:hypothetical protein